MGGAEAAQYTQYLTPLDRVVTLAMMAITAAAAVQLFRMKCSALPIFVAALLIGVAIMGFNFAFRPASLQFLTSEVMRAAEPVDV